MSLSRISEIKIKNTVEKIICRSSDGEEMPVITVQSLRKVFTSGVSTRNSIVNIRGSLQIANPQTLELNPQSQISKFLRCSSPQIASPQIFPPLDKENETSFFIPSLYTKNTLKVGCRFTCRNFLFNKNSN